MKTYPTYRSIAISTPRVQQQRVPARRKIPNLFAYGTVSVAVLFFTVFYYYPFLMNLYYMFTNYSYIGDYQFIGLKNITRFFQDPSIRVVFSNTFILTIATVPIALILALFVAIAVFYMTIGKALIRSAIFSTTLVTGVVAAIIFKLWFSQELGYIDNILESLHFARIPWLTDTTWALTAIVIVGVWSGLGYNMVIYLAGLANVSKELLDASRVDGANATQRFYYVMIPQLKPTILFLSITLVIGALKTYAPVAILTEGGPYGSTRTALLYMFQKGFDSRNVGYGSVIAFALFIIILIITLVQMKATRFYAEDSNKR
ncbi:glycerol-3-phosphate ABC transporter permease [Dictyobacter alpinus]|uniref:Glycerol-3-phosphate ABC transporter permease n=1 Tax=Dictyobacter alpinus TaxID=2014873 RepID=A0A402B1F7_9CHLR|nr:sugar ABC transporter permease [Dictyobacter alpinus]GCE25181.1 glycerol-3-phosphate ABC transporter permease [Dictyobacter alpinus]